MAAITQKHLFGWKKEEELLEDLQKSVGQVLEKTPNRFDTIDFEGDSVVVELKSRLPRDKYGNPQNTWLVPVCKADWKGKPLVCFYYWSWDQSLWRLDYDQKLWDSFERNIPVWKETQEHYYVPAEAWTLVQSN